MSTARAGDDGSGFGARVIVNTAVCDEGQKHLYSGDA